MHATLLQKLTDELVRSLSVLDLPAVESTVIQESLSFCDIEFGDYSTNLAMTQARLFQLSPREVADRLAAELSSSDVFSAVEVAGPGFINIRLAPQVWTALFDDLSQDGLFESTSGQGKRVNIEFISANPTGPLVLVNAWGGYYGDILARVYAAQGYTVTREYYLNDGGNQIAQLGRAIQQAAGKVFTEEESAVLYRGEYVDRLAERFSDVYGGADALLLADPQVVGDRVQAVIFDEMILPTLQRLNIHHDVVTPETTLDNQTTLHRLESAGAVIKKDGATWLSAEEAGLPQDEVLVRSTDNQETYFLKDISYQLGKLEDRSFDVAITIVGPDHHGQEQRLLAALKLLGVGGFVPLWTQTVRLLRDGQEFKMSKRRGNYILLDEFLDQVPSDTARFFFAMRDTNSHFDLDLDLLTVQAKHNPLYYVMYAYVRSLSVLSKAEVTTQLPFAPAELTTLERSLIRKVIELDEKVRSVTTTQSIHPILHNLIQFASIFHDWYEQNPVLTSTGEVRQNRLALVQRSSRVIAATLKLIGITPIEKM